MGRSIVQAWGFAEEIAESVETEENLDPNAAQASLVDVVYLARLLIDNEDEIAGDSSFQQPASKLNVSADSLPALREAYSLHAQSMRQSAGG